MKIVLTASELILLRNLRPSAETIQEMRKRKVRKEDVEKALSEGRWELC